MHQTIKQFNQFAHFSLQELPGRKEGKRKKVIENLWKISTNWYLCCCHSSRTYKALTKYSFIHEDAWLVVLVVIKKFLQGPFASILKRYLLPQPRKLMLVLLVLSCKIQINSNTRRLSLHCLTTFWDTKHAQDRCGKMVVIESSLT